MTKAVALSSIFGAALALGWSTPAQADRVIHEVLTGESLAEIAQRYEVTPRQIRRSNKLQSNLLRPGQKLSIRTERPDRARHRARYRVRKGDSPARIAKKNKMSLKLFRRLNPGAKHPLRVGQVVWVARKGRPGAPRRAGRRLHQLQPLPGFQVLHKRHAWGTFLTVDRLTEVLTGHHLRFPDGHDLLVGDLSRRRGGYLPPHRSHRTGRDVDIRYPLKNPDRRYVAATRKTLDVERTWDLIHSLIKTGDVVYVFVDFRLQKLLYAYAEDQGLDQETLRQYFQYPRSRRSMAGIIRHERGHRTHLHVRFRKEQTPPPPNS